MNKYLKLLCSIPVILIVLYFIPFLGICLILFRYYVYKNNKSLTTSIYLLVCGLALLIPKLVESILKLLKLDTKIPVLNDIISSDIYNKIIGYSKLLIALSIIFAILSYIFKNLYDKLDAKVESYVKKEEAKKYQIQKENDLIMRERKEKADKLHSVHCPYCGSDNLLSEKIGTCKSCRRKIQ